MEYCAAVNIYNDTGTPQLVDIRRGNSVLLRLGVTHINSVDLHDFSISEYSVVERAPGYTVWSAGVGCDIACLAKDDLSIHAPEGVRVELVFRDTTMHAVTSPQA